MKKSIVLLVMIFVSIFLLGDKAMGNDKVEKSEELVRDALSDPIVSSLAKALRVANNEAKKVGFNLNESAIFISKKDDFWMIEYGPKNKNTLGGTLIVEVDWDGKIKDIEMGQ